MAKDIELEAAYREFEQYSASLDEMNGTPAPVCRGGALSAKHYSILCCCIGRLDGMREAIPKAARPFYDDTLDLLAALAREIRPVLKSE